MIHVGLTHQQEQFCRFYVKATTKTEAVILAGYTKKAPIRQLQRLLTNKAIVDRINELKAKRNDRVDISADDVIFRINHLATEAQKKGEILTALRCLEVLLKHLTDTTLRERKEVPAAPSVDKVAIREEATDNVVALKDAARRAKQARSSDDD